MKKEKSQEELMVPVTISHEFVPKLCSPGPEEMFSPSPVKDLKPPTLLDQIKFSRYERDFVGAKDLAKQ